MAAFEGHEGMEGEAVQCQILVQMLGVLNTGIASVSQLMDRLKTGENNRDGNTSVSNHVAHSSIAESSNQNNAKSCGENSGQQLNSSRLFW